MGKSEKSHANEAGPQDYGGITAVPGLAVGHYTDEAAGTGCTVVLCEAGAVGGVAVRGSAPGTRETDVLRPLSMESTVHSVLLGGGSAFGLDAASGVVRYLEERGIGLKVGPATVPIVPAAILFDLAIVTHTVRPGADEGFNACTNASTGPVAEGAVGAGTGATVGKLLGMERAVKGGIGTASVDLGGGLVVGAIVAVNAVGGVYDPDSGRVLAGPRGEDGTTMYDSLELITSPGFEVHACSATRANTTIGVVATNASLSGAHVNKLADVAHDGLALAIRPAHTMADGDTMFALATGSHDRPDDMIRLCAAATLCVSRAIVRAVLRAKGIGGIPAISELANHDHA